MSSTHQALRDFIHARLAKAAARRNIDLASLAEGENLFEAQLIDSLGFLELVGAVETEFDVEIDFSELDPEEFTTLGGFTGLCIAALPKQS